MPKMWKVRGSKLKTIKFTIDELVVLKSAIKSFHSVGEQFDSEHYNDTEWKTEKQCDKFCEILRSIEDKIPYITEKQKVKIFHKTEGKN